MIVVDATVAVKLLIEEPGAERALARLERDEDRVAPAWIRLEVTNALVKKVRKSEIPRASVIPALRSLSTILTELTDPIPLVQSARELALDADHAVYDCLYLALAITRDSTVITHDRGFAKAAARIGLSSRVELLA